jgi:hypothetical protein
VTAPPSVAASGTILLAGLLTNDDDAKHEFDRIDDELRALATSCKVAPTFRFRVQLCKLMAQVDAGPIGATEKTNITLVPQSWSTKHPILSFPVKVAGKVAGKIASEISSVFHHDSKSPTGNVATTTSLATTNESKTVAGPNDIESFEKAAVCYPPPPHTHTHTHESMILTLC